MDVSFEFSHFHTKDSAVHLQRFDENSLKKCLEKNGVILEKNIRDQIVGRSQPHSKKTNGIKERGRKKSEESTLGSSYKRRKRKVPCLCYSDEEDSVDCENALVVGGTGEDGFESRSLSKTRQNATQKMSTKETRKRGRKKSEESTFDSPYKRKKRKVPPLCYSDDEDSTESENVLTCRETSGEDESLSKTEHAKTCVSTEMESRKIKEKGGKDSGEIQFEVVGEEGKVDKKQEQSTVEPTKEMYKSTESEEVISSESPKKILQEDECESGEEDEDDRETVVFEEEFGKDNDLEVIFEEKKLISKQLKNREITNRKKQRLVKFKRKSMTGRNSAKTRNPKSSPGRDRRGQDLAEKPTADFNEDCLKEVCSLVKRLHELYRIILQLQREHQTIPNNTELAVHFARVIHAQQENFHREIRESQKTVIKCYQKMLTLYKSATKVALEISKETFLSVDDIVSVISRCILVEEHCEGKETPETTGNSLPGTVNGTSAKSTSKKNHKSQTSFSIPKHMLSNPSKHSSGDSLHWLNEQSRSTHFHTPSVVRSRGSPDPTIPQKLTMRNRRLEAEPALTPTNEDVPVAASLPTGTNADDWGHRASKSRVYVCAHTDCENPGVRVCKRCYSVIYCSEACQLKHWTLKHKVECYLLMQLRR